MVLGRHQKGDIVSSLFSVKPPSCEHKHEKKKSIAFSLISYSGFFLGFIHRVFFLLIEGLPFKSFLVASYLSVSRCFLWYFVDFCGYLLMGLLAQKASLPNTYNTQNNAFSLGFCLNPICIAETNTKDWSWNECREEKS